MPPMYSITRLFANHVIKPLLKNYLAQERTSSYKGITIKVLPGVFHPGFFFSSKYLLQYLLQFPLANKRVLELGAGSGLLSFAAEKNGAFVTATDLSAKAIENLQLNKSMMKSSITILKSDLFAHIPVMQFDFVAINPPYYPKQPVTESEIAWYCGTDFQYFEKLFSGLTNFLHPASKTLMVLSEDCDIIRINLIAAKNHFIMKVVNKKKFLWEWNYLFEIERNDAIDSA